MRFFNFLSRPLSALLNLAGISHVSVASPPQLRVTKYCMAMVIRFDTTQYSARPLGKDRDKKVNISGSIICIVRPCACCLGSVVTGVVIFCDAHIEAPTSIASMKSELARFIHRKCCSSGNAE
jgi:hypothetical protein